MAISARYAGICKATGKSYKAGTMIEKGPNGWQIAGGASVIDRNAYETPMVRTPEGEIKTRAIYANRPHFHGACVKAASIDVASVSGDDDPRVQFARFDRAGNDFTCRNCGGVMHIFTASEEFEAETQPNLYITESGSLSHKVPTAQWEMVKQYFSFVSYADMAEAADDMDNFDEAAAYEEAARYTKGEYQLRDNVHIPTVEKLLGIYPGNSFEPRRARQAEVRRIELEAAKVARDAKIALGNAKRALFDPDLGEYVQPDGRAIHVEGARVKWEGGHNIYGGGEELVVDNDGAHVWLLRNNGMDGDDWSRNNVGTGGAGAIGYRFELTPERLAFVRSLPGGERINLTTEERTSLLLTTLHERKMLKIDPYFRSRIGAPLGPLPKVIHRVWTYLRGEKIATDLALTRLFIGLPSDLSDDDIKYSLGAGNGLMAEYTLSEDMAQDIKSLWPAWVGTSQSGRFLLDHRACSDAANALRLASNLGVPMNSIDFMLGVTLESVDAKGQLLVWSDGVVTTLTGGCTYIDHARRLADDEEYDKSDSAKNFRETSNITGFPGLADRDRELDAAYIAAGFPPVPDRIADDTLAPAATKLIKLAIQTDQAWNDPSVWGELADVTETTGTIVDHYEENGNSSGTHKSLTSCEAAHANGTTTTYYLVTRGWWAMGEDGDASETTNLYRTESEARARYQEAQ